MFLFFVSIICPGVNIEITTSLNENFINGLFVQNKATFILVQNEGIKCNVQLLLNFPLIICLNLLSQHPPSLVSYNNAPVCVENL